MVVVAFELAEDPLELLCISRPSGIIIIIITIILLERRAYSMVVPRQHCLRNTLVVSLAVVLQVQLSPSPGSLVDRKVGRRRGPLLVADSTMKMITNNVATYSRPTNRQTALPTRALWGLASSTTYLNFKCNILSTTTIMLRTHRSE